VAQVQQKSSFIEAELTSLHELDYVGDIRQLGFMVGIELVQEKEIKKPFPWEERVGYAVSLEMRRLGMLTRPLGDNIVFMPPLSSSEEEIREMIRIIKEAIQNVTTKRETTVGSTK